MFPNLPEPSNSRAQFAGEAPGFVHIPLHMDIFGYYLSFGRKTLIGGTIQFGVDRYSAYGNSFQIEHYQPSASYIYFLDEHIGSGLFVRLDAGPAMIRIASNDRGTEHSDIGIGGACSVGFSVPIKNAAMFPAVHFAFKSVAGKRYNFFSTGFGILF